jgi:hypothetical protein
MQISCTATESLHPEERFRQGQRVANCCAAGPTTISTHALEQYGYSLAHSQVGQDKQVIRKRPDQELVAEESTQAT